MHGQEEEEEEEEGPITATNRVNATSLTAECRATSITPSIGIITIHHQIGTI